MSGGEIPDNILNNERDIFEEHREIYLAQRQSKRTKLIFFFFISYF